jgi:hypothetical protein
MPRLPQPYRLWREGQIALQQALFDVAWERFVVGTARSPRCADEVV